MQRTTRRTMLFATISFAALSTTAQAAISLNPANLAPGTTYHLAFVTSDKTHAQSSDIAYYNSFVRALASSAHESTPLASVLWHAIVNVHLPNPPSLSAPPPSIQGSVHLLNGQILATDATQFWYGALFHTFTVDENLDSLAPYGDGFSDYVWTGVIRSSSPADAASYNLGGPTPSIGDPYTPIDVFTSPFSFDPSAPYHIYALSSAITVPSVIPEASSLGIWSVALAGILGIARRRRGEARDRTVV